MATQATLETLAVELKQMILHNFDDVETLRNVTQAVPSYNAAYLTSREEILTCVTLNMLRARGIEFSKPATFLHVYLGLVIMEDIHQRQTTKRGTESRHQKILQAAIQSLYDQITSVKDNPQVRQKPIVLEVEQCVALRSVEDVIAWEMSRGIEYLLEFEQL